MPSNIEDLQMLRLIKAFQQIADPDVRRAVIRFVEEQLEKQQEVARRKLGRTEH